MKTWSEWETVRAQVSIAGRVVDEGGRAVAGAEVTIAAAAEGRRKPADPRVEPSHTAVDGLYYVLNVPAGTYTVRGVDHRAGTEGVKTVSVSSGPDGKIRMAVADLTLAKVARASVAESRPRRGSSHNMKE